MDYFICVNGINLRIFGHFLTHAFALIQLFKSVFTGREDVFAVRWKKGSKSGYMPAYYYAPYRYRVHKMNIGTFQNYTDKEYLALSEREIEKHLNGEQHIGIYPLLKDNFVIWKDFLEERIT